MITNFCGNRYNNIHGNWEVMYHYTMRAFHELGYEVHVSPHLKMQSFPEFIKFGIQDSSDDIYVHNHTYREDLHDRGFFVPEKCLFLKPTGPSHEHFTIDTRGYAAGSDITYKKPDFENIDSTQFFQTMVPFYKEQKSNKWKDRQDLQFSSEVLNVPDNHILLIGQMPGDETVTKMSFGDHWNKFCSLVNLLKGENLVIKVHPTLESEARKNDCWETYAKDIHTWLMEGLCVFYGFESLYDILPKTRVAIVENSTAGVDCILHEVPVISYGYPEYHWVTKDLRHLHLLREFIQDLSWWKKDLANKWVAWYCTKYQCYNYASTLKRVKEIVNDW